MATVVLERKVVLVKVHSGPHEAFRLVNLSSLLLDERGVYG
jgi:hypothetical protein